MRFIEINVIIDNSKPHKIISFEKKQTKLEKFRIKFKHESFPHTTATNMKFQQLKATHCIHLIVYESTKLDRN